MSVTSLTEEEEFPIAKPGVLPIYSVTAFTMLDFPDRTACIIWFSGCNMRCGYCHNPQIVTGKGRGSVEQILAFLKKRQGLLDGVVLSGGEATAYPGLPHLIGQIKNLGYAVKLDTNGLHPRIIRNFLERNYLDYVALDYKAPPEKFKNVTSVDRYADFSKTLDQLCGQDSVPFEVRTTVHSGLMDESDIIRIMTDLDNRGFRGQYFVQNFRADNARPILGCLDVQHRAININNLPLPRNFRLGFRNF